MQELIDMLRAMGGACKVVATHAPIGMTHAIHAVAGGAMPGIRIGLGHSVMLRISLEKPNNVDNAEASSWNTLWIDPTKEGDFNAG